MNKTFDLAQIITTVSVVLVVIGWFVNQWLNRKNEIAKEARGYRLDMLHSFQNLFFLIQKLVDKDKKISWYEDTTLLALMEDVRIKFQTYGKNDEVELYEKFISVFEGKHVGERSVTPYINDIIKIVRWRIREELKLEKIDE